MSISKIKVGSTDHEIIAGGTIYATCETAAGTAAKVASVSAGVFSLVTGARVSVKFTYANSVASPTLNVASTGAKAIYWHGAALASSQYWQANAVLDFIYNGTQWELIGIAKDNNTTYSSLKNPNALTVQGNGTSSFTYDGSAAKTLNIKAGTNVSVSSDTSGNITISATDTNTVYTHPTSSGNKHIPSGGSSGQILRWSADGTAAWGADNNTTYGVVSTSADGLAPKRDGSTTKFLRGDGTWAVPPDTNTTYSAATTSAAGLMSASDKSKLDGIASGANKYSLPTASSSTLGGVKTTSTVTSTSGLTACPIISGVPYYKDTNTTYSLSSFGVTATAAELNALDGITATVTELNYCDGVTSNIQTQLNGKAATHSHPYLSTSGGNVSGHIYLTGAQESSSTGNTSQIVFGTSSNNHVAISSNDNALVINPSSTQTTNQIVLYLDKASLFPNGISGNASSASKVNQSLAVKLNGGSTEGTNLFTFNGSAAKTVNITPSSIGAAPAYSYGTEDLEAGVSPLESGKLYFVYE